MPIKFRLKGLAETFVDSLCCPGCGNDGGESGDEGFRTDLSRVTFDGIIAVVQCDHCKRIFVPDDQRLGVIDKRKLIRAVENDSLQTGEPIYSSIDAVRLDVERLNASQNNEVH